MFAWPRDPSRAPPTKSCSRFWRMNSGSPTERFASSAGVLHGGVPLGVLNQQWWARSRRKKRNDCTARPLEDKETRHWVNAIHEAATTLRDAQSKAWFQIDREGDRYWTLKALRDSGEWFTVRSTYAHPFVYAGTLRRQRRLRDVARKGTLRGVIDLDLRERSQRKGRVARMRIRTATVVLDTWRAIPSNR